jgi:hypothetical protein
MNKDSISKYTSNGSEKSAGNITSCRGISKLELASGGTAGIDSAKISDQATEALPARNPCWETPKSC